MSIRSIDAPALALLDKFYGTTDRTCSLSHLPRDVQALVAQHLTLSDFLVSLGKRLLSCSEAVFLPISLDELITTVNCISRMTTAVDDELKATELVISKLGRNITAYRTRSSLGREKIIRSRESLFYRIYESALSIFACLPCFREYSAKTTPLLLSEAHEELLSEAYAPETLLMSEAQEELLMSKVQEELLMSKVKEKLQVQLEQQEHARKSFLSKIVLHCIMQHLFGAEKMSLPRWTMVMLSFLIATVDT